MNTMRLFEQADLGDDFTYSWILEAPYKLRSQLEQWEWVPGHRCPGCYVTKDQDVAKLAAEIYGLTIQTNNTHAVIGAPKLLAT
jgi:hypothetical protein